MAKKNKGTITKNDIGDLITAFEDNHSDLLDRMDADFDLYTLVEYKLDDQSENVTSNEPRVFADKIIQTCEAASLNLRITTPEDVKKTKKDVEVTFDGEAPTSNHDKESALERLGYGLINIADRSLRRDRIINGRSVQSAQWFFGAVRGAMCQRVVLTRKDNKSYPDILPVDPRYFSFGIDDNGMAWGAVTTWRDPMAVKTEYGIDVDDVVKCIDFWDTEKNIIQIGEGGAIVDQITQSHKLGRVPFVYVPVGSSPLIYTTDGKFDNVSSWGESIYSGGRGMYNAKNMALTVWLSLLKKSHKRSCFIITPSGKLPIEKVPWGTDQVVTLPADSKIEWVNPPDIAMSAPQLYRIIDQEIQKADLATIEYGLIAGTEYPSGKAIMNLQEGRDSKVTPLLKAANALWEDTLSMLFDQYEKSGTKLTVNGYDSKGKLFYQEIKPTDVKQPFEIECKWVSITPEQETQNIAKAQMLASMGMPDEYILDKAMQAQDPQKIIRQKKMALMEVEHPIIRLLHEREAAQKEGRAREVEYLTNALIKAVGQFGQPQQPQPQQLPEGQQAQPQPPAAPQQGGF